MFWKKKNENTISKKEGFLTRLKYDHDLQNTIIPTIILTLFVAVSVPSVHQIKTNKNEREMNSNQRMVMFTEVITELPQENQDELKLFFEKSIECTKNKKSDIEIVNINHEKALDFFNLYTNKKGFNKMSFKADLFKNILNSDARLCINDDVKKLFNDTILKYTTPKYNEIVKLDAPSKISYEDKRRELLNLKQDIELINIFEEKNPNLHIMSEELNILLSHIIVEVSNIDKEIMKQL